MHFFLYNFFGKARYLEEKWNIIKSFVSNLIQTLMYVVAYPVLCTVLPLKGAVEEFCVFQLFLASLPNVWLQALINLNLYDINGPGLTLDLQYPSKLGVCIV